MVASDRTLQNRIRFSTRAVINQLVESFMRGNITYRPVIADAMGLFHNSSVFHWHQTAGMVAVSYNLDWFTTGFFADDESTFISYRKPEMSLRPFGVETTQVA
jgi:hypothetical protein